MIVYVDYSDIHAGAMRELRAAVAALAAFIEEREPQLRYYGIHVEEETSRMWVVVVHPDAASLVLHLHVGGPEFRKVGEFITLRTIDVFGEPGDEALELLREKARVLGGASLAVHALSEGFARI
ncbi:MAG TPA: hypothetical protein VF114_09715 [Candidatus Limnocylindria bacterium]